MQATEGGKGPHKVATSNQISQEANDKVVLTKEDFKRLLREYDDNGDGEMSDSEMDRLLNEYRSNKVVNQAVREILEKFDTNRDGDIDKSELSVLKEGIDLNQSKMRYISCFHKCSYNMCYLYDIYY